MKKMYNLTCDPSCGFHVETHDKKEAIRMGMEHVADAHPSMKITTNDVKKMVK